MSAPLKAILTSIIALGFAFAIVGPTPQRYRDAQLEINRKRVSAARPNQIVLLRTTVATNWIPPHWEWVLVDTNAYGGLAAAHDVWVQGRHDIVTNYALGYIEDGQPVVLMTVGRP